MSLLPDLIAAASASYEPDRARRDGGRALFDYLACRADGRRRGPAELGDAGAAVFGDLDDLHWPSLTHPGAIVWTAIRDAGISGESRWRAGHVGYEVTARLGEALGAEHRRYWHATTTAGTIGGAAAVAIGVGADAVAAAGHAISVTGGSILCVLERTDTRMLHRDHAAATAGRCAALSHLTASSDSLEHPQGLFAAMGGSADRLLDPSRAPALGAVSFRRHQTSGFCQAVVDAAAELAPGEPDGPVDVEVPEATVALAAIAEPADPEQAWWSAQHAVAVTLLGLELGNTPVDEPTVARLRGRIRLGVGPVSRVTTGGRSAARARADALTDADLIDKWRRLNPTLEPPTELLS